MDELWSIEDLPHGLYMKRIFLKKLKKQNYAYNYVTYAPIPRNVTQYSRSYFIQINEGNFYYFNTLFTLYLIYIEITYIICNTILLINSLYEKTTFYFVLNKRAFQLVTMTFFTLLFKIIFSDANVIYLSSAYTLNEKIDM